MEKKISKITAGVMGVLMGSAVIFGQPKQNMYIDINENIATTQSSELAGEVVVTDEPGTETVADAPAAPEQTDVPSVTE